MKKSLLSFFRKLNIVLLVASMLVLTACGNTPVSDSNIATTEAKPASNVESSSEVEVPEAETEDTEEASESEVLLADAPLYNAEAVKSASEFRDIYYFETVDDLKASGYWEVEGVGKTSYMPYYEYFFACEYFVSFSSNNAYTAYDREESSPEYLIIYTRNDWIIVVPFLHDKTTNGKNIYIGSKELHNTSYMIETHCKDDTIQADSTSHKIDDINYAMYVNNLLAVYPVYLALINSSGYGDTSKLDEYDIKYTYLGEDVFYADRKDN